MGTSRLLTPLKHRRSCRAPFALSTPLNDKSLDHVQISMTTWSPWSATGRIEDGRSSTELLRVQVVLAAPARDRAIWRAVTTLPPEDQPDAIDIGPVRGIPIIDPDDPRFES